MKKQTLIRTSILVMLVLILAVVASAQSEFTVPLTDPAKRGKLKAHLNYGSITVKGTGRKDVLVKYKADEDNDHDEDEDEDRDEERGNKSRDGLKRISGGGMDLEVTENNNMVKASSDSWNNKLNLEIEVPSGFDLEVSTYNDGDLMITNIQGEVELTNYNGEITALNISGSVVATTYNGEIKVTFDKVTDGAPMSYHTYNGDVDITLPAATKASFKMKTEQGEIYTGFEMKVTSTGPKHVADTKTGKGTKIVIDDWKKGDINGGGAEITLKTNNGDIYVRKK
jgi:Putative adhesin